jgi:hypothetical protein
MRWWSSLLIYGVAGQFAAPEGKISLLADSEAQQWFVDDWGNPSRGVNASFVHWVPPKKQRRGRIAIIQTGMYDTWNWKPTIDTIVRPHVADVSRFPLLVT